MSTIRMTQPTAPATVTNESVDKPAVLTGESVATKTVISVREFTSADQEEVANVFQDVIMTRFEPSSEFYAPWGEYTQKRLRSDMGNIQNAYIDAGGNFWVAVASSIDGTGEKAERIVGIIGLDRTAGTRCEGEGVGEVRSVFVDPGFHRRGVGRALVTCLVN